MPDSETPFLDAIRANPLDELPRLVFSDWLEENGDERYRWVRVADLFARMGDAVESPIPRLLGELEALRSATTRDDDPFPEEFVPDEAGIERIRDLLALCGPAVVPAILGRSDADRPWPPEFVSVAGDPKWDNFHITVMKDLDMEPDPKGDILNRIGIDRRQYLLWTLQGLKGEAAPAIPALQKLLDDRHDGVRYAAAGGLAAIGAPAATALKKAARHRDPDVKAIAEEAFAELDEG